MNSATLLAKMFAGGGGGGGVFFYLLTYSHIYVSKFVSHIHNCYQTDQYNTAQGFHNIDYLDI